MPERSDAHDDPPPRWAAIHRIAATAGALSLALSIAATGCRTGAPGQPAWMSWLARPPDDCALGFSGATLYPGDALRQSRIDALTGLLRRFDETRIESEAFDDGEQRYAWTHQVSRGRVEGARIVAMWSDPGGARTGTGARVYSLACMEGVSPEALSELAAPDWLMNPPGGETKICAPAVAGPTLWASDQRPAAIVDGQEALADALESDIEQIVVDDERHRIYEHSSFSATSQARARAEAATDLEREWMDVEGDGPLAIPGTLYALVCIDR